MVGDRYESYDAWKAVAAVGTGMAIGTMLAKPPAAARPIPAGGAQHHWRGGGRARARPPRPPPPPHTKTYIISTPIWKAPGG